MSNKQDLELRTDGAEDEQAIKVTSRRGIRLTRTIPLCAAICLLLSVGLTLEATISVRSLNLALSNVGIPSDFFLFFRRLIAGLPNFDTFDELLLDFPNQVAFAISAFFWFSIWFLLGIVSLKLVGSIARDLPPLLVAALGLRTERASYSDGTADTSLEKYDALTRQVEKLRSEIRSNRVTIEITDEEKKAQAEEAKMRVLEEISDTGKEALLRAALSEEYRSTRIASLRRLGEQGRVYGTRANLNLVTGLIFCSFGLFILWASLFDITAPNLLNSSTSARNIEVDNWLGFFQSYLPRLSLVLIIELIGFFFLKLYTRTLDDIRYVQNELTNVEAKLIAMDMAILNNHSKGLSEALTQLAQTERNAIIGKNQTSIEIEKQRALSASEERLMAILPKLLHGTEHGSVWRRFRKVD
ncbi:hypothetical protein JQT77_11210 [Sulfitobacter mediterraneus]|nr:hypothetical protein [Sulfitobacter mediterraneus]MBM1310736.1 hypothetical protein [Sulfitobacter mediterraneus]MBM1322980.1 hypothetical protein [Sulfitobacter mediterraneus]MBM1326892.1 hypothetical protein [Sulfitobacter mediterraneus]MBM1398238.1 hypothetical protein [Sulfitobacter mediterraneus]MBM1402123.1 hypothetical protein [Sulfitobacter mediterraneus]